MIFLVDYDRRSGRLVSIENFDDTSRDEAQDSRLQLELDLARKGLEREVVLLEAIDEGALRRTHRRYFEDLAQLVEWPNGRALDRGSDIDHQNGKNESR